MVKKQYGKIINNQLMNAPSQINDGGYLYCGVPDDVYLKYGYKPLIFTNQPDEIPRGYTPTFKWEEYDEEIRQEWFLEKLTDDYNEQLRKNKGRFNRNLSQLKKCIEDYCKQKEELMFTVINQNSLVTKAYNNLLEKGNYSNISEAMQNYEKFIPCNFFAEVDLIDCLKNDGFYINLSNDTIFVKDPEQFYTYNDLQFLEFISGKVFEKDTKIELYPVPGFGAIKFIDASSPVIVHSFDLFFILQTVDEMHKSFTEPNIFFNMAFTYLHTIMDDFLTSMIRFHISSFPKSVDMSKNFSVEDILSINSMTELKALKNNVIDEKVARMGHTGYREKIEFFKKRGIEFKIPSSMLFDDMIWLCERRNAIVHNSSIVNHTIEKKLFGTSYFEKISVGENVALNYNELMAAIDLVKKVCEDMYKELKNRFKL